MLRGGRLKVKRWVVADMDDTLLRKLPPGQRGASIKRPCFGTSPCFDPMSRWLAAGNGLVVVTTDDGYRPYNALWDQIPKRYRCEGRVLLSTSDGAALYVGDPSSGAVVEVDGYSDAVGGDNMCLPNGDGMTTLLQVCREVFVQWIRDLHAGSPSISSLSDTRLQRAYGKILEAAKSTPIEQLLSIEQLITPGRITKGSVLWRNQIGPSSSW